MASLFGALRSLVTKAEVLPYDLLEPFPDTHPDPLWSARHVAKSKVCGSECNDVSSCCESLDSF